MLVSKQMKTLLVLSCGRSKFCISFPIFNFHLSLKICRGFAMVGISGREYFCPHLVKLFSVHIFSVANLPTHEPYMIRSAQNHVLLKYDLYSTSWETIRL